LKNDLNVPSKSNKQRKIRSKNEIFFVGVLKVTNEKQDQDQLVRYQNVTDPEHILLLFHQSYPLEGRAWAVGPGPTWVTVRPGVAAADSWLGSWWGRGSRG
jgi:hypothetical protein